MKRQDALITPATIPLIAVSLMAAVTLSSCKQSGDGKPISLNNFPHINTISLIPVDSPPAQKLQAPMKGPVTITLDPSKEREIGLVVEPVRTGMLHQSLDLPGRVGPDAELSRLVSTPSAGRVIDVKVKLGENVRAGQVLAIIKSDPIGQVQSDLLQNALQAKADIKQQEVQLKLSHITFERESRLYTEQVSAKMDLQAAENQLEKDNANLASLKSKLDAITTTAQERLTLLGAPPDSAMKVIRTRKIDPFVVIRAPISGLLIDRSINPGELADGTKPLFTITDLSEVWLFADVFEKDVERVKEGQEALVTVDSVPDHKFPAKLIWVGDAINPTTRTLSVRATVHNPKDLLKPGMFARIKIDVGDTSAFMVSASAVLQEGDRTLVFVDTGNGAYQEREVEVGKSDGKNTEILSGLKPGERVARKGGTALLGAAMKLTEGGSD